jgi:hypothetical protein
MRLTLAALAFYASVAVGRSQPLNADTIEKFKDNVAANPQSSLAHFRLAESYLLQKNFQSNSEGNVGRQASQHSR